jgi:hypothetical protein
VWDKQLKGFKDVVHDIFEQHHFKKSGETFTDFELYL